MKKYLIPIFITILVVAGAILISFKLEGLKPTEGQISDSPLHQSATSTSVNSGTYEISAQSSLISLDVYDAQGSHDGLIKNLNSDIQLSDVQIPNSQYENFGLKTYVSLSAGGEYTITLHGLTNAPATVAVKFGDQNLSYDLGQINKNFVGKFFIHSDYSISPISIDANGDGVFEDTIYPQ